MLLNLKGNSPSVPEEVPKFVKTRVLDDIIAIAVEEREHVTSYCTCSESTILLLYYKQHIQSHRS